MPISPGQKLGRADASSTDGRVSQGAGQIMLGKGGLGYIARRGVDFGTSILLQSIDGVARLAVQQPLELLGLLPDIVPEVGLAAWNGLRLGCGPGAITIKAMTVKADGGSEEDPQGTAAINKLFDNLDDEVGGLEDCLSQNFMSLMFGGMCAVEAVPGPRGTGLKEIWPVNSLTLRFKREDDGKLALYQRQTADPSGLGVYTAGFGGMYVKMPMERFFWSSMDKFPDDPYGRAPFAPALTEVLRMISFINDMQLAFHRVGMPRLDVGFDFEATSKAAKEIMGLTAAADIDKWVQTQFNNTISFFNNLNPDDAFFHDVNSKVEVVGSGKDMPDLQKLFDILRYRLIIGLKQNPVLMAYVNGSTETWSDVQWEIYGKGIQSIVMKAAMPLWRCAQLHLRLLGRPLDAVVEYQPIRSIQRLQEAQAEQIEIANEAEKVAQNWQLNSTASMKVTGSDIPSEAERNADVQPKQAAAPAPSVIQVTKTPQAPAGS